MFYIGWRWGVVKGDEIKTDNFFPSLFWGSVRLGDEEIRKNCCVGFLKITVYSESQKPHFLNIQ
jgi:hypothetical protein